MKVGVWYEATSTFDDGLQVTIKRVSDLVRIYHLQNERSFVVYKVIHWGESKANGMLMDNWNLRELTLLEIELL